jgi:hypothetical protein
VLERHVEEQTADANERNAEIDEEEAQR